jgi:predicted dehydrogenase
MSASGKIGIAIQGAGNVSTGHLRAYLNNPACEVVAIGSRTKEGAASKAREVGLDPNRISLYDEVEALVADPRVDALSICSPHTRHAEDTIAAAQAGKHCLVEKPIAMTLDELRAMDAAVREAGIRTVCGFVLRWIPSVTAAVAMRERGLFGNLLYVQTDYWHNPEQSGYPDSHDYIRRKVDASAMLLGGCHAVDLARFLMGSDIVAVSALTFTNMEDAPHPPNQVAIVHFANGKAGKVSACLEQWAPYQFNVDILGDAGAFRHNRFYSKTLPGVTDWVEFPTITPDSGAVSHHPFQGEIDHFLACIIDGKESHVSVRDAVNTHEACFAIDRSCAEEGAVVTLQDLTSPR